MDNQIAMTRPVWEHRQYFLDQWKAKDITVLVCQRKTKDNTQLCLESLLSFYPDVPLLIVDGNSADDSLLYCKWLAVKNPNITVWERPNGEGFSSHGVTMHEALTTKITTKYVLLLDSDTIIERGGWIEEMAGKYKYPNINQQGEMVSPGNNLYAIGSLMLTSKKGQAIHGVDIADESDVLRYAHPSCSMIDREKYLEICKTNTHWHDGQIIPNRFSDHGSPCVWNMMGAEQFGYAVEYFPVDKYVSHLSGASWCNPKTIWPDDHGVKLRPFVTFIGISPIEDAGDLDNDFDIVDYGAVVSNHVVIHGRQPVNLANGFYEIRFKVIGEYVCENTGYIIDNIVTKAKQKAIELNAPETFEVGKLKFTRRDIWQKFDCLK